MSDDNLSGCKKSCKEDESEESDDFAVQLLNETPTFLNEVLERLGANNSTSDVTDSDNSVEDCKTDESSNAADNIYSQILKELVRSCLNLFVETESSKACCHHQNKEPPQDTDECKPKGSKRKAIESNPYNVISHCNKTKWPKNELDESLIKNMCRPSVLAYALHVNGNQSDPNYSENDDDADCAVNKRKKRTSADCCKTHQESQENPCSTRTQVEPTCDRPSSSKLRKYHNSDCVRDRNECQSTHEDVDFDCLHPCCRSMEKLSRPCNCPSNKPSPTTCSHSKSREHSNFDGSQSFYQAEGSSSRVQRQECRSAELKPPSWNAGTHWSTEGSHFQQMPFDNSPPSHVKSRLPMHTIVYTSDNSNPSYNETSWRNAAQSSGNYLPPPQQPQYLTPGCPSYQPQPQPQPQTQYLSSQAQSQYLPPQTQSQYLSPQAPSQTQTQCQPPLQTQVQQCTCQQTKEQTQLQSQSHPQVQQCTCQQTKEQPQLQSQPHTQVQQCQCQQAQSKSKDHSTCQSKEQHKCSSSQSSCCCSSKNVPSQEKDIGPTYRSKSQTVNIKDSDLPYNGIIVRTTYTENATHVFGTVNRDSLINLTCADSCIHATGTQTDPHSPQNCSGSEDELEEEEQCHMTKCPQSEVKTNNVGTSTMITCGTQSFMNRTASKCTQTLKKSRIPWKRSCNNTCDNRLPNDIHEKSDKEKSTERFNDREREHVKENVRENVREYVTESVRENKDREKDRNRVKEMERVMERDREREKERKRISDISTYSNSSKYNISPASSESLLGEANTPTTHPRVRTFLGRSASTLQENDTKLNSFTVASSLHKTDKNRHPSTENTVQDISTGSDPEPTVAEKTQTPMTLNEPCCSCTLDPFMNDMCSDDTNNNMETCRCQDRGRHSPLYNNGCEELFEDKEPQYFHHQQQAAYRHQDSQCHLPDAHKGESGKCCVDQRNDRCRTMDNHRRGCCGNTSGYRQKPILSSGSKQCSCSTYEKKRPIERSVSYCESTITYTTDNNCKNVHRVATSQPCLRAQQSCSAIRAQTGHNALEDTKPLCDCDCDCERRTEKKYSFKNFPLSLNRN